MPTANKEVHFSLVECSNTPVVIKQERQVGSRVVALVLYSFSSVFKDTARCIRQKGSTAVMKTCYYPFCKANASAFCLIVKRSMNKDVATLVSFLSPRQTLQPAAAERANTSRPQSFVTQRSQGRDSREISRRHLLECCWLAFSLAAEFLDLVDAAPPTPTGQGCC